MRATIRELGPTLEAARPVAREPGQRAAAASRLRAGARARRGRAARPASRRPLRGWPPLTSFWPTTRSAASAKELRLGAPVTAQATTDALPLAGRAVRALALRDRQPRSRPSTPRSRSTRTSGASEQQPAYLDFLNSAVNTAGAAANFDGNGSLPARADGRRRRAEPDDQPHSADHPGQPHPLRQPRSNPARRHPAAAAGRPDAAAVRARTSLHGVRTRGPERPASRASAPRFLRCHLHEARDPRAREGSRRDPGADRLRPGDDRATSWPTSRRHTPRGSRSSARTRSSSRPISRRRRRSHRARGRR